MAEKTPPAAPGGGGETALWRWILVAAAVGLLVAVLLWPRGAPPAQGFYAQAVVQFTPGRIQEGSPFLDPKAALGPPDNKFVSLGIGGQLVLDMKRPVRDVRQLVIWEATGVVSSPRTPVLRTLENETVGVVEIAGFALSPLAGDEAVLMGLDPSSNYTRIVLTDGSQEPIKYSSGIDIDAVEIRFSAPKAGP